MTGQDAAKRAEVALDGWTRLQEKRCDEGEWVQLRGLIAKAIDAAVAEAVKELRVMLSDAVKEREMFQLQTIDLKREVVEVVKERDAEIARLQAERDPLNMEAAWREHERSAVAEARREERELVIAEISRWSKGLVFGIGVAAQTERDVMSLLDALMVSLGRPPASAPEGEK